MKKNKLILLFLIFLIIAAFFIYNYLSLNVQKSSILPIIPKPLDKYTIENLANTNVQTGNLIIKDITSDKDDYSSYSFEFTFNPNLDGKTLKKTTGVITLPNLENSDLSKKYPIILMIRGYIDQKLYKSGDGTKNAANEFAKNGYITIAPDFLGYAGSDKEADNVFEARFQTYITILSLIKTIENTTTLELEIGNLNIGNLFIWAHSNGGQIALTVLEITGKTYPTVLWAPVSKPFPYSILYYTDEADDHGKMIRKRLAEFENDYDVEKYSLTNYLDRIKAPIQLNQGSNDESVPKVWSDNLSKSLKDLDVSLDYIVYPGSDHNMRPSWNNVIENNLKFFAGTL
jgi:dipeptidyl aminopeptidase/acylaminoacyl peptidase